MACPIRSILKLFLSFREVEFEKFVKFVAKTLVLVWKLS